MRDEVTGEPHWGHRGSWTPVQPASLQPASGQRYSPATPPARSVAKKGQARLAIPVGAMRAVKEAAKQFDFEKLLSAALPVTSKQPGNTLDLVEGFKALAEEVARLKPLANEVPRLREEIRQLKEASQKSLGRPSLLETVLGPFDDSEESLPAGVTFSAADFSAIASDD